MQPVGHTSFAGQPSLEMQVIIALEIKLLLELRVDTRFPILFDEIGFSRS